MQDLLVVESMNFPSCYKSDGFYTFYICVRFTSFFFGPDRYYTFIINNTLYFLTTAGLTVFVVQLALLVSLWTQHSISFSKNVCNTGNFTNLIFVALLCLLFYSFRPASPVSRCSKTLRGSSQEEAY